MPGAQAERGFSSHIEGDEKPGQYREQELMNWANKAGLVTGNSQDVGDGSVGKAFASKT